MQCTLGDINLDLVEMDYQVVICHSSMVKLGDMMDRNLTVKVMLIRIVD